MTKEKGRHVKRLSRRRFLKILGGGAVYGAGGGLIGKGYQSGRDFYKSKIQPVVDKGQEVVDGFNKYNPLNLFKKPHDSQESYPKKEEKTDRRTFFQRLWSIGHEYPIETGITVGTVLGSGKTAVKDYFSRREKMKAAKALDDLEEKVSELEEKLTKDSNEVLIALGFVGIIISFLMAPLNLTGFSIADKAHFQNNWANIIILGISLIAIIIGLFKKKYRRNLC